jgi:hypothetical protein
MAIEAWKETEHNLKHGTRDEREETGHPATEMESHTA